MKGEIAKKMALTAEEIALIAQNLKMRDYTSPKDYGILLAYRPRHQHAKGKRVLHTLNYPRKGVPYTLAQ